MRKLKLHWFCTQNHILEPFSVRRACTQRYVTSEPYPRPSHIWCQNVRETRKKIVIKCRGESFVRCRVIARYVEGGGGGMIPSLIRVKACHCVGLHICTQHMHSFYAFQKGMRTSFFFFNQKKKYNHPQTAKTVKQYLRNVWICDPRMQQTYWNPYPFQLDNSVLNFAPSNSPPPPPPLRFQLLWFYHYVVLFI